MRSFLVGFLFFWALPAGAQTPTSTRITNSSGTTAAAVQTTAPVGTEAGLVVRLAGTLTTSAANVGLTGAAIPTSAGLLGLSNLAGTLVAPLAFDYDTGAGTQWIQGVGLRISSAGGSIEAKGQQLMALSLPVVFASDQTALDINCLSGCGGASSFLDNAAFTIGTTPVNIAGYLFDDVAPTAATENSAAAPRMSSNRVPYGQIRDAAGNERGANVTAGNALSTDLTSVGGTAAAAGNGATTAGTQRVTLSNDGTGVIATVGAVTTVASVTSVGAITNALPVGANVIGKVSIDQATPGTTNLVQVTDGAGALNVIVDSSALPSGAATSAAQTDKSQFTKVTDGTDTAQVTATSGGALQVECVGGTCGGAATFSDNSAFTFGTTGITNIGGVFDDVAPNAVAENSAGTPRISANRNLYTALRDAAGNERGANVTAGNALVVDGSASTQPVSGTVTVTDGAGALNVIVDSGTVTTVSSVTAVGTITPGTAASSLGKAEDAVHGSGDVGVMALSVINTSGATLAADGDYAPIATNTLGHVMTDARTLVGTTVAVNNGAVSAGVQRVTVANDSTGKLAAVDTITNPVTVTDGAGALNVIVDSGTLTTVSTVTTVSAVTAVGTITPGTAATSLGKAEDAVHASGDVGVMALGVANEAGAALAADGDYTPIATTTKGYVRTDTAMMNGVAVTMGNGASGTGVQRVTIANDSTGTMKLNDGTDTALITGAGAILIDGSATTQPVSGTVTVTDGAGALNVIVDSGTITTVSSVTAVGTITPGTAASSLGKAEDAVHASGDVGVMSLGVANEAAASLAADGDYTPIATNTKGYVLENTAMINGVVPLMGNGASGTGAQRVTLANDSTGILAAVTSITNAVTVTDGAGALNVIVDSGTITTVSSVTAVGTITPGTAATSLGKAEDAVAGSGDVGVMALGVSNEAGTVLNADGDYSVIATNTKGQVLTDFRTVAGNAIAAGNGASSTGVLRVAQVNDGTGVLATVTNVATIGTSVTPGTAAGNLGKAEDAIHATGDTGVMALHVANEANTAFAADGDYTPAAVDTVGRTVVVGPVADGGAVGGRPVRIAGKDGSGNTQDLITDTTGNLSVGTGTAGAAASNVVTVQGIASGTAITAAGNLTTNNAAPAGTNIGVLAAVANVAPPAAATEGRQVLLSTDLIGGLRVNASADVSATQTEVLVLASASTACPTTPLVGRKAVEIQNLGPNAIFCKPGGSGVVNTTRKIAAGATWAFDAGDVITVGCKAATADQLTTAATIVTELK
jgi:hypothetical protein